MNKCNFSILVLLLLGFGIGCQSKINREEMVNQLHLEWELESNFVGEDGIFQARFIINNHSDETLMDEGWALFFNMSPRKLLETNHVHIEHLNGDWYKMRPKIDFNLPPGASISLPYKGLEGIIKESDAPMGLYFVFYNQKGEEEDIVSVDNFKVRPFIDEEQLLRGESDREDPYSPLKRFEENAVMTKLPADDLLPIIPTPYNIKIEEGEFKITEPIGIFFDKGLKNEAQYLHEKLEALTGTDFPLSEGDPDADCQSILLKIADVQVNGQSREAYQLSIDHKGIKISGSDEAGVFYGVQSLLSLTGPQSFIVGALPLVLPYVAMDDAPRFPFRSLHMDVARNFQDKKTIKRTLDLMAHYKLNHFLFYTSEDEGWRLEIPGLPELTTIGGQRQHIKDLNEAALHPAYGSGPEAYMDGKYGSGFYTREEFIGILIYAKERHITIIPELNFPGHARAAIKAMEARYDKMMERGDESGAEEYRLIDPEDSSKYLSAQSYKDNVVSVARASTYRFYEKVVDEMAKMYVEAGLELKKIHAGGDEVPEGSWTGSPMAAALLDSLKEISDPKNLQAYFFRELLKSLEKRNLEIHVWEEMALLKTGEGTYQPNPEFVGKNVIPYIWNNMFDYPDLGYQLANMGYEVVLCNVSNFYFDLAYDNDPLEPGLYWAGFVNTRDTWTFAPFDWFKTTYSTSMGHKLDQVDAFKDMVRIKPEARKNILGLEAQLWGETIKGREMAEYYMLPKMLGFAESAWAPERNWEDMEDYGLREKTQSLQWNRFANTIARREYPKLAWWNGGYNYRIAPPGVKVEGGKIFANVDFPGLEIRFTTDGSKPEKESTLYQNPLKATENMKFRAFDIHGNGSREINIEWP
ncbi:MAG: family 20 glycosylhydrolase [Cyclobacteriaceae bacterium]